MSPSTTGPSIGGAARSLRLLVSRPAFTPATPSHAGVCYREGSSDRGTPPCGDVYLPEGPGPHPSVVLIHGGGFVVGSRGMKPAVYLATRLVEAGFAVFVPSYRQIFRGGRLTEMVKDAKDALQWWSEAQERYALDPSRTWLMGKSAGCPVAMLAAEDFEAGTFRRFISIFGIYDLKATGGLLGNLMPRFLLRSSDPEEADRRSPLQRSPLPMPVTLLHGTADRLVPFSQAEAFAERRAEQGIDIQLIRYEGEEHSFFSDASQAICEQAMGDILQVLAADS